MPGTVLEVAKLREPVRHIPSSKSPRAIMAVVGEERFNSKLLRVRGKVADLQGEKVVSITDCDCMFYTSMSLPCRHIFALRSKLEEPLFDPNLAM